MGDKEFYVLQLGYTRGGHMGGGKAIIEINGKRPDFFGRDYSKISRYSGTDMTYIDELIKEGENTFNLEFIPPDSVADDMKKEPFIFHMSIEHAMEGEILDSQATGNVFDYEVTVEPDQPLPKGQKTFTINRK